MKFNELLNELLNETVRKEGNRYYIFSHRTGKKIGKNAGYGTRGAAVSSMMMIASHGGFAKNPHKSSIINKYMKRHEK
jgi:hypothetical protein